MKDANPRQAAFDILCRVEQGAFSDLALDGEFKRFPKMDPRDRGLATELVYGVLRQQGRLDFALTGFCKQPLAKVEGRVLWLLRIGAYQLLQLSRVPVSAAVNETVEVARKAGLERATGFLNGVLRALERGRGTIAWPPLAAKPLDHLTHALSLPSWLGRRWLRELGAQEAALLAEALLAPAPFSLRTNTLAMDRDQFLEQLHQAGHEAGACRYAPEGVQLLHRGPAALPGADQGWFQVQDQASMLVAHLLAPQPGDRLLDACSAPGGKTTHLAALADNRAAILALDLHPKRLALVSEGALRLGCNGIVTQAWDLTRRPDFLAAGGFDRVLLDAPCSGLGVLRRNPEIRWRRNEQDIRELAARQLMMLRHLAPVVRPGGRLLYSLCTQTPEETSQVVDNFLAEHPHFSLEDLRPGAPAAWQELFDASGRLCSLPHRHDGMDAFFAARFLRRD